MEQTKPLIHRIALLTLLLLTGLASASTALGQVTDQEPNNTCAAAHDYGSIQLPLILNGSLDSTDQNPDVDFFKFTGPPNTAVVADLEGSSTGRGTLSDPFLGLLDSNCTVLALNDDGGVGLNSKIQFTIPANGVFIMAVTKCCDGSFLGGGVGTYRLTVARFQSVNSIGGRVVDAVTGAPLPGNNFPFTRVELRRCTNGQCFELVNSQSTNDSGQYRFDRNFFGALLPIGTYQVFVSANLYVPGNTAPFVTNEGEDRNLGDFQLTPLPRAGSISGRLVDANNGIPLPGNTTPFASALLIRCEQFGCFNSVAFQNADSMGRFQFDRDFSGNPLLAGRYRIQASANSYQQGQTEPFDVAENEHKNVGDVFVPPFPLRISDVRPCGNLPASGGSCVFSITLTNGLPNTLFARTWLLVDSFSTGSFLNFTTFPAPEPPILSLPSGASRPVELRFEVPDSVRGGAIICPRVFVGQAPSLSPPTRDKNASYFNTLGQSNSFCIVKQGNGFRVLSEQESRAALRQVTQQPLVVDPGKH